MVGLLSGHRRPSGDSPTEPAQRAGKDFPANPPVPASDTPSRPRDRDDARSSPPPPPRSRSRGRGGTEIATTRLASSLIRPARRPLPRASCPGSLCADQGTLWPGPWCTRAVAYAKSGVPEGWRRGRRMAMAEPTGPGHRRSLLRRSGVKGRARRRGAIRGPGVPWHPIVRRGPSKRCQAPGAVLVSPGWPRQERPGPTGTVPGVLFLSRGPRKVTERRCGNGDVRHRWSGRGFGVHRSQGCRRGSRISIWGCRLLPSQLGRPAPRGSAMPTGMRSLSRARREAGFRLVTRISASLRCSDARSGVAGRSSPRGRTPLRSGRPWRSQPDARRHRRRQTPPALGGVRPPRRGDQRDQGLARPGRRPVEPSLWPGIAVATVPVETGGSSGGLPTRSLTRSYAPGVSVGRGPRHLRACR